MSGSLTHSPADVVRYLLIAQGLGTLPSAGAGWPVFASAEPDSPDSVITVYDTEGRLDAHEMVGGVGCEHHGVNIRVRDARQETAFAKARTIAVALDEDVYDGSVTISTSVYLVHAVTRTGGVLPVGREPETDRSVFTLNAVADLRQTT